MNKILSPFYRFAKKRGIIEDSYLVGGTVRDIITSKKIHDYDITINDDTLSVIKAFADEISASFIVLDEKYKIVRVIKEGEFIDFSAMKGGSIQTDLSMRDFTINAMAIKLSELKDFSDEEDLFNYDTEDLENLIIDPFDGLIDLRYKIIRMLSEENLLQDPLRLLRAYRFSSTLNFLIEPNTYNTICKLSPYISNVAVERIAEELRQILIVNYSFNTIRDMYKSGLLVGLFPVLKNINHETIDYNILSYSFAEQILNNLHLYLSNHRHISDYFTEQYKITSLKLAILFSSNRLAITITEYLKLSKKETQLIQMILDLYEDFIQHKNEDKAQKIDFLRMLGDMIYPLVIYAFSKERISYLDDEPILSYCKEMIEIYHQEILPKKKLLPLITGDDLIREFKLPPSPLFKTLLDEIEALFLKGIITNRQEALIAAKKFIQRGLHL